MTGKAVVNILAADAQRAALRYQTIFGWPVAGEAHSIVWGSIVELNVGDFVLAVHSAPAVGSVPAQVFGAATSINVTTADMAGVTHRAIEQGCKTNVPDGCVRGDCLSIRDMDGLMFEIRDIHKLAA